MIRNLLRDHHATLERTKRLEDRLKEVDEKYPGSVAHLATPADVIRRRFENAMVELAIGKLQESNQ